MDQNIEAYTREAFEEKAAAGDRDAMWQLSLICQDEGDSDSSAAWFERALDAEQTDALLCAADICLDPESGAYSPEMADGYLRRAAEQGSIRALLQLGRLETAKDKETYWQAAIRMAREGSEEQPPLPEHQRQFGWYKLAAEAGDPEAMYYVALGYHLGYPVAVDQTQAFGYLSRAVEENDLMAMYLLGYLYENGLGTEQDIDRAVALYERSGEQGVRGSLLRLYGIYNEGLGHIAPDRDKALRYLWMSGEGHT